MNEIFKKWWFWVALIIIGAIIGRTAMISRSPFEFIDYLTSIFGVLIFFPGYVFVYLPYEKFVKEPWDIKVYESFMETGQAPDPGFFQGQLFQVILFLAVGFVTYVFWTLVIDLWEFYRGKYEIENRSGIWKILDKCKIWRIWLNRSLDRNGERDNG